MNERIEKALTAFLQFRKVKGLSPRTLKDYRYFIGQYAALVPHDSEDYRSPALVYLGEEGLSNATLNIRHAYLKAFFTWSIEEGFFACAHPLKGLKKRPPVSRIINISNGTIAALLGVPNRSTFCGLRDFSLIMFSLDTGCRPNEALSLKPANFDFNNNVVEIPAPVAKTRRARSIPISPATADTVQELLSARRPEWESSTVFCSQDGGMFNQISWYHNLTKYAKRIGTNIAPYHLRHAAALGMLRQGMSAFHLKSVMGHASISMTEKYISLQIDDLQQAHAKASLINAILPPQLERFRQRKIA